jgi:hypothetical protein
MDGKGDAPADATARRAPWRRLRRPSLFAVVFGLSVAAFLAIRLGSSLVGARVFAGLDVFDLFPPWSHLPGAADPVTTSHYVTDHIDNNFPAMHEVRERLLRGDLAAWSSQVAGGVALLGTINYGMLSPGRFLFFVLPTWLAPAWAKLAEMSFAGAFTYLLVRRLGGSRTAAGLAGFVYPMTGFIIGWTNWTQTAVASIIPMLFWAVERFLQQRRVQDLVPVSLATALLLFGGFPAVAGQSLYLAAGYAVVRVLTLRWSELARIARDLVLLGASVVAGIALSAVQLLPFAAQVLGGVDLSYREGGFYEQVPLHYMLTTVFPASFAGNNLPQAPASPIDLNAYVGGIVVLLAALGLLRIRRMGRAWSAAVYMVLVLALVVGLLWFQGSWSAWLGHLPVFDGNPIGRLRSQIALPAAVLAALGVDWILAVGRAGPRGEPAGTPTPGGEVSARERAWGAVAAAAVAALIAVAALLLVSGRILGVSEDVPADVVWTLVPVTAVAALVIALAVRPTARLARATVVVAAVGVVLQAFPATAFYWPTAARDKWYATSDGIAYLEAHLGHDRLATLGLALRPNTTHYYGLRILNGHAFMPEELADVVTAIDPSAFTGGTYSVLTPAVGAVATSPGLDRFGVRYLVAQADSVQPGRPGVPVLVPGVPDAPTPLASVGPLTPGATYVAGVPPGAVRGVHVPLEVTQRVYVSLELRDASGAVLATNARWVPATAGLVDVPMTLALDDAAAAAPGPWSVAVVVNGEGVTGTFDADGDLRVQAVRPFPEGDPADDGLTVAQAGDGMTVWERASALPRIRWAGRAVVIEDDDERIAAVATRPTDPGEVILSEVPDGGLPAAGGAPGEVEVLADDGDTVRVRTAADGPGFVVVSDTIQLDFAATVDGRPAEILPADHAGGAVAVPAGEHLVEITYASVEQRVGAVVSALSAVVLALAVLVPVVAARRRARRRPAGGP